MNASILSVERSGDCKKFTVGDQVKIDGGVAGMIDAFFIDRINNIAHMCVRVYSMEISDSVPGIREKYSNYSISNID